MTHSSVTIQITPESAPSLPSWMGEVAAFAQVLAHVGILKTIQTQVQFARARFGTYDTIDFVVVLLGYALSGERTLHAFYERLGPFADVFMALFDRDRLPDHSTLSRFLSALDQTTVEALRTQFQEDLVARSSFGTVGGLWDRFTQQYVVVDVDGTRQAASPRALPHLPSLPAPHRRFDQVAAPGYKGRKRGEVVRTRTTLLQAHTHQFLGTFGGAGNGDYREELKRAIRVIVASHHATATSTSIGKKRDGMVYELFVTRLATPAFSAKDVLDLYRHRGSFETVLADEDIEQDPDRWCSHTPCGQEFWQILSQWVWNLRLELGQHFSPAAMRTTEFAPAFATEPAPPVPVSEPAPVLVYGPPHWAQRSFTCAFPGTAFPLQPDGNFLCPANHPLSPQKQKPHRVLSYRLLYAARIGDCRSCRLRASCLESMETKKPRRVSAVFWPISSNQALPSTSVLVSPESTVCCPVRMAETGHVATSGAPG